MTRMIEFRTRTSQRIPDPIHPGAQRYSLMVNVADLPEGIPDDPNPRTPISTVKCVKLVTTYSIELGRPIRFISRTRVSPFGHTELRNWRMEPIRSFQCWRRHRRWWAHPISSSPTS